MASQGPELATPPTCPFSIPNCASPYRPTPVALQGNPPAGCRAEPPVPGCAAGGPPPEGLGRPGHRHWGRAAAARCVPLGVWQGSPGNAALRSGQQAPQKRGPSPKTPGKGGGEEKGIAKWKPPKLGGTSCAVPRANGCVAERASEMGRAEEETSRTATKRSFTSKGALLESTSLTHGCKRPHLENAGLLEVKGGKRILLGSLWALRVQGVPSPIRSPHRLSRPFSQGPPGHCQPAVRCYGNVTSSVGEHAPHSAKDKIPCPLGALAVGLCVGFLPTPSRHQPRELPTRPLGLTPRAELLFDFPQPQQALKGAPMTSV